MAHDGAREGCRLAARLCGAAAAIRATIGSPLSPGEHPDYDEAVEVMCMTLGEQDFAAAQAAGTRMPQEEAIALARAAMMGWGS